MVRMTPPPFGGGACAWLTGGKRAMHILGPPCIRAVSSNELTKPLRRAKIYADPQRFTTVRPLQKDACYIKGGWLLPPQRGWYDETQNRGSYHSISSRGFGASQHSHKRTVILIELPFFSFCAMMNAARDRSLPALLDDDW